MADIKYYDVILKPVVTEKATGFEMEEANKYTFLVHVDANKTMIKDAVERMFEGTKVVKVNTINVKAKPKRYRYTSKGLTRTWKKAMVTLKEGDKIELFGNAAI